MVMPLISQNWDFQPFKMLLKDNLQMFNLIFPMEKAIQKCELSLKLLYLILLKPTYNPHMLADVL